MYGCHTRTVKVEYEQKLISIIPHANESNEPHRIVEAYTVKFVDANTKRGGG